MSEVERTAPPWSRLAYLLALVPSLALGVQGIVTARTLNLFEQGTVVAGAAAFIHGDMLYSDHFAFYGPLAYLVPYAGIPLFGVARGIFVIDLVVGAIMCLLVYALARRISNRAWLALLAPLILALAGGTSQRNMMALASVLALVELERSGRRRWAVAAGASAALALLWFQDTGVWVAVATGLAAVLIRIFGEPKGAFPWDWILRWFAGWSAVLVPWCVYLAARGALRDWVYYCFIYPNSVYTDRSATGYLRSLTDSWQGLSLPSLLYKYTFYLGPYVCVGLIALLALGLALSTMRTSTALAPGAGPLATVTLAIVAVLQLRLVVASLDEAKLADCIAPTVAIGVALGVRAVPPLREGRLLSYATALLRLLVALLLVMSAQRTGHSLAHAPLFPDTPAVQSGELQGIPVSAAGPPVISVTELDEVIEQVEERTGPDDPVFVVPTQPMLYVLADRRNPTAYDYLDPHYTTSTVDTRMRRELAADRPAVVVVADNPFPGSGETWEELAPLTYAWVLANYAPSGETENFTFYEPIR